jgi:hypothetical protein
MAFCLIKHGDKLTVTTNVSTGLAFIILKILMTCLQNFEQNDETYIELQCYTVLSYISSTSAEKKSLLIHEGNSFYKTRK